MTTDDDAAPALALVGDNPTLLWGMTNAERMRRVAAMLALRVAEDGAGDGTLLVNLAFAIDPAWVRHLRTRPGALLTLGGIPVLAYGVPGARAAMIAATPLPPEAATQTYRAEDEAGLYDEVLRKRERPFVTPLTPANVAGIERASYVGAYKGVTDLLTKYLWPEWAFALTRLAARAHITPNQVTAAGTVLCILATIAFWHGWFWTGIATGLVFMVLDTVDGKLARCTVTSSRLGDVWDHGIDLVHPPFWWWAWAEGCAVYGRPLTDTDFWGVIAAMLAGYVVQRLIEGAFIARFGMHIHVWRRFDSRFRLVTARRNPNMVILVAALLVGRPDWGIVAVAAWTILSLGVHAVRLMQAVAAARRGETMTSWLA